MIYLIFLSIILENKSQMLSKLKTPTPFKTTICCLRLASKTGWLSLVHSQAHATRLQRD